MTTAAQLERHLDDIIAIARLAPSVHNTQPWLATIIDDQLELTINKNHSLVDGDPTGRQTVISLGIFSEAVSIAAQSVGLTVTKVVFQDTKAVLSLQASKIVEPTAKDMVRLLSQRCSDRSIYQPATIDQSLIKSLGQASNSAAITVHTVIDNALIQTIAQLTSQGIRLALSSPAFRNELSHCLVLPWSKKKRGIAVKSLYIFWLLAWLEPWLIKLGIGLDAEAKLEKQRWQSASAVIVITAQGDMPTYWFEVGRVYLKVSLLIEKAGLSQATSAAIVEASDFHEDIEKLIGTSQRIQSTIRIGKGVANRQYSPRLNTSAIITSS